MSKINSKAIDDYLQSPTAPLGPPFRMTSLAMENEAMRNPAHTNMTTDGERFATFGKSQMTGVINGIENSLSCSTTKTYENTSIANNPLAYIVGGGKITANTQQPSGFNIYHNNQSQNKENESDSPSKDQQQLLHQTSQQHDSMDAFNKMQKKFDSLMNVVSQEEEKFREIEKRHIYSNQRTAMMMLVGATSDSALNILPR